jgi:hypothetical protein
VHTIKKIKNIHSVRTRIGISGKAIPLLFFANKSDLPKVVHASSLHFRTNTVHITDLRTRAQALTTQEISKAMGLNKILDRPWTIVKSNALKGEGIETGIKWLSEKLKEGKSNKKK